MKRRSSLLVILLCAMAVFTAYCGSGSDKQEEKQGVTATAIVSLDSVRVTPGDSVYVPVRMECEEIIAGIQLHIQFDPKIVSLGKPLGTNRSSELQVMHNVKDDQLLLMMFSMSGKGIQPGKGIIARIPVRALVSSTGSSPLNFTEGMLATQGSETVPVTLNPGMVTIRNR